MVTAGWTATCDLALCLDARPALGIQTSDAIGSVAKHPLVAGLDAATERCHLLRLTRRLVDLPD
jgi:hypothetical protein